jgi:hypothetical protein
MVVIRGHAFVQNLRRGDYDLGLRPSRQTTRRSRIRRTHRSDLTRREAHHDQRASTIGLTQRSRLADVLDVGLAVRGSQEGLEAGVVGRSEIVVRLQ